MDLHDTLHRLAGAHGIATEFWDWQGRHVVVSDESIARVLAALGVDVSTPETAERALREKDDAPWARMLPPALVIRSGWGPTVDVHLRDGANVDVWIELEGGGYRSNLRQEENWAPARLIRDRPTGQATFRIPDDLPLGYHRLKAWSDGDEASMRADRHARMGGPAGPVGRAAVVGHRHPAVQRAVGRVLGRRRRRGPGGPGRLGFGRNSAPATC